VRIFSQEGVHPPSEINMKLFSQIDHHFEEKNTVLDLGCGSGIFSLAVLSKSKVTRLHVWLSDIS
jgi:ribosomal protein L11 methylase PrmA